MSLAGLKKQINKANQFVSEKIGGAKGTELDEEYLEMEKKVDATERLVNDLMVHTQEYLQPNPALRAKLMTQNAWSKVRGQARNATYPQPEGTLGEALTKHGEELGGDSSFGAACVSTGESFKQLAEIKYSLEETVKRDFLDPLGQLQSKDFKEIGHHRKKLEGRRLDYDCKRRKKEKGTSIEESDLNVAEEKFQESKELTETAMNNLLANNVEQISQLKSFIEAVMNYHKEAADILEKLHVSLKEKAKEADSKPRRDHVPKRVVSVNLSDNHTASGGSRAGMNGSGSLLSKTVQTTTVVHTTTVKQSSLSPGAKKPCAQALYDFEPENEGELGFREGDMIELAQQIDENWFEGKVRGQTGFFPINYVKVIVPL